MIIGIAAGRGREQAGQDERPEELAPARGDPLAREPLQEPALVLVERQLFGRPLRRCLRPVPRHDGALASPAGVG